ncbi:MAG: hypothetical protein K0R65_1236 [Crocinitomicaceae bacterium]|nr:hypothetical protein [Crocinitomicaceae bacterium]
MKHVLTLVLLTFSFTGLLAQDPVAHITSPDREICACESVTLSGATSEQVGGPIVRYIWSVFGGNPNVVIADTTLTPTYTLPLCNTGTYSVSLIVQDQDGDAGGEQEADFITVNSIPTAAFSPTVSSCLLPYAITYGNGSSTGGGITYAWTFSGGSPSSFSGFNPSTVTYNTVGNFSTSLIVVNTLTGCRDTMTTSTNISNFQADIAAPATACLNAPTQFTDMSTIGASSWSWSVILPGQQTATQVSTAQNPMITFNQLGTHRVVLNSQSPVPCQDSDTITINVVGLPLADFTVNRDRGCSPLPVTFTNLIPIPANTYTWTFGDGQTFTGLNAGTHVYIGSNGQTFNAVMTVEDVNGCIASDDTLIIINKPEANFSTSLIKGCELLPTTFTNLSTAGGTPIVTYLWDFGNGVTSNAQNPPVQSFTCGEYNVSLTVTDQQGCVDVTSLDDGFDSTVVYMDGPGYSTLSGSSSVADTVLKFGTHTQPNFMVDHNNDCIKKPFELSDLTVVPCPYDDPQDWMRFWLFNDVPEPGDSVHTKIFSDTNQNTGTNGLPGVDVGLRIDFRGCIDQLQTVDSIYVSGPQSKFTVDQNIFCDNNFMNPNPLVKTISIDDSESIYGHKWDDNNSPQNPTIIDSTVANLAFDRTEVTFRWGDGTTDFYQTNAQGVLDGAMTGIEDGDHATNVNPANATLVPGITTANPLQHTYTQYGSYEVWQIIRNYNSMGQLGCTDSTSTRIDVSYGLAELVFSEMPAQPNDIRDSVCINNLFSMLPSFNTTVEHVPVNYSFDMDNGSFLTGPGSQATFTTSYSTPGLYDISLTMTNSVGCVGYDTIQMRAFALPVASITSVPANLVVCEGNTLNATLSNASTHPAGSYDNGGGVTASWASTNPFVWSVQPQGTIVNTQNYNENVTQSLTSSATISLTVTDAFGCVSAPAFINANVQKPTADFGLPDRICNETAGTIPFSGNGNIAVYEWTVNGTNVGGNTSSIPYSYFLPDTQLGITDIYRLIVTDTEGCKDTIERQISVRNPQADFTASISGTALTPGQEFQCPPIIVDFTDQTEHIAGSTIIQNHWYHEIFQTNPGVQTADVPNPSGMQYIKPGVYDLTYAIMDDAMCPDTIHIDSFLVIHGPTATPDINMISGACNQTFTFDLGTTTNVVSWSWTLGDGTTVFSAEEPDDLFSHQYPGANTTYATSLTVLDANDCPVEYELPAVTLPNDVDAFFTASPDEISLGTTVVFDPSQSTAANGPNMWIWDFGDGRIDTVYSAVPTDITNQYAIAGEIPVLLTLVDNIGCKDNYLLTLNIDISLVLPNVFTGFGSDGPNADLLLFADVFKDFNFLVVNRWGNVVFDGKRDASKPRYLWDGIDQKSGKLCQDGTYFYIITGVLKNDEPVKLQGFVSLVGSTRP